MKGFGNERSVQYNLLSIRNMRQNLKEHYNYLNMATESGIDLFRNF